MDTTLANNTNCTIGIDLGSNTLRVIKFNCQTKEKVAEYEKIVRTAQGLVDSGIVSKEAIKRVIEAINEAKEQVNFNNCKTRAVTTQALRVAKNQKEAIKAIKEATNIEFEVINAKEEALLTLKAVKFRLKKMGISDDFILIDIGGGSTEITIFIDGKIYTKSFDLGIVTVTNQAKNIDEIEKIINSYNDEIKEFLSQFNLENLTFVATAGTPTTIAALKHNLNYNIYSANIVNGTVLTITDLDYYLKLLLNATKAQKEQLVGVGRDDLIVAGVLIYKNLYKLFNKNKSIVIDDGLREGVALELCRRLK